MFDVAYLCSDDENPASAISIRIFRRIEKKFGIKINVHPVKYAVKNDGLLPDESITALKRADAVFISTRFSLSDISSNLCKSLGLYCIIRCLKPYFCNNSLNNNEFGRIKNDCYIVNDVGPCTHDKECGYRFGRAGREAYDTISYPELEIERIQRLAYELSEKEGRDLVSADNSDTTCTGRLWRKILHDLNEDYPSVCVRDVFVRDFVGFAAKAEKPYTVVSSRLYGNVISDFLKLINDVSSLPFSIAGDSVNAIYGVETRVSGFGRESVNPLSEMYAAAMLLDLSFNAADASYAIDAAIEKTTRQAYNNDAALKSGKDGLLIDLCNEVIDNI